MGYFSRMSLDSSACADTLDTTSPEVDDEFEIEYLVHLNRASVEGFQPLTKEQFYAAAHAALAKIDAIFPAKESSCG